MWNSRTLTTRSDSCVVIRQHLKLGLPALAAGRYADLPGLSCQGWPRPLRSHRHYSISTGSPIPGDNLRRHW